ncbi:hypothetical protein Lepto7376_3210 [[Leptolyngbya] sp. PCC 7376]|uniref:DUF2808 domain-containing protein n=1 Tax=[Leptolyngbya] sp. PCC 7376 TaxID=111781 RepID=UPI00029F33BF|nr:DUF2808 domain-containing protein [[Leptolyngbya] sp. PCC 7376]AFY39439.1 hypothetical protein Lepto7376_3210 [[Leptolyngbya] sp. PCC 7376]
MQFFRSTLSRLAIATTLLGSTLAIIPQAVEARQPCGSFTINWGGTVRQGDILKCAVEWNTGAGRNDRYYLDIKKSKISDNFRTFELSFPKEFDGEINDEKIRVRVNGKEVELIAEDTAWDPVASPVLSNTQSSSETVANIENASASAPAPGNTGGELVIDESGNLVFVDQAELAEQEAIANAVSDNSAEAIEDEAEVDSDEPRSRSLFITLAEPLKKESEVEIILDRVENPSSGGMYVVTAFARTQGAPFPSKLGAWFLDVEF